MKIQVLVATMHQNDYAFTSTDYEQIDDDGAPLNRVIKTVEKINYNRLLLDCLVGNSTVMYNVEKWVNLKSQTSASVTTMLYGCRC